MLISSQETKSMSRSAEYEMRSIPSAAKERSE